MIERPRMDVDIVCVGFGPASGRLPHHARPAAPAGRRAAPREPRRGRVAASRWSASSAPTTSRSACPACRHARARAPRVISRSRPVARFRWRRRVTHEVAGLPARSGRRERRGRRRLRLGDAVDSRRGEGAAVSRRCAANCRSFPASSTSTTGIVLSMGQFCSGWPGRRPRPAPCRSGPPRPWPEPARFDGGSRVAASGSWTRGPISAEPARPGTRPGWTCTPRSPSSATDRWARSDGRSTRASACRRGAARASGRSA
jgi:hypothetical protein